MLFSVLGDLPGGADERAVGRDALDGHGIGGVVGVIAVKVKLGLAIAIHWNTWIPV